MHDVRDSSPAMVMPTTSALAETFPEAVPLSEERFICAICQVVSPCGEWA